MANRLFILAAAASVAATPAMATDLHTLYGERRSGATAGAYLEIPFGGSRSGKPGAGLQLKMTHDYRDAVAQTAPVLQAKALDLRLVGDKEITLYLAGAPITGEQAKPRLAGGEIIGLAVVAAAVVGTVILLRAFKEDDESPCPPGVEVCAF
jgi:hypothetical protein